MQTLEEKLKMFQDLSRKLVDRCKNHPDEFPNDFHSEVKHRGQCKIILYFSDKFKTWSVTVDGAQWSEYKTSYELDHLYIQNPHKLIMAIDDLNNAIKNFDMFYKPRKRSLNFN